MYLENDRKLEFGPGAKAGCISSILLVSTICSEYLSLPPRIVATTALAKVITRINANEVRFVQGSIAKA